MAAVIEVIRAVRCRDVQGPACHHRRHLEKRPVSEVARSYGVARSWVYTLRGRYEAEGEAAFEQRSRRPRTSPRAIAAGTVELIVRLRKELAEQGLDAGPHTITWHLAPAAPSPGHGLGRDRQPDPGPPGPGPPRPVQAAQVVLPAVPGGHAE